VDQITRIAISSSLSLSLGFEVILSSLLLSTLKLNIRMMPEPAIAEPDREAA
jgi:hypothetical protein